MKHLLNMLKNRLIKIQRRFFVKEIDYINGPDTLPPPLKKEEEERCLAAAEAGNKSARDKLVVHNLRLVVYIAKKFENTGVPVEDLVSIGTIGLMKGVNTFRCDKNIKLATYASRCIENEILMYLRKTNSLKAEVSYYEPLNTDWDGNELLLGDVLGSDPEDLYRDMEWEDRRQLLHNVVESLNEREKLIVKMRFGIGGGEEHTQKEVADLLGISQSYISRLEKKIVDRMKNSV